MDTGQIMQIALSMAGMKKVPPDSGIIVPGRNIRKVLFGIDIGEAEILLAKQLGFDLVIAHHPIGEAGIRFHEVVARHAEFMVDKGVPRKKAEKLAARLADRIEVRSHPSNYGAIGDFARKLGVPLMNIHQPLDQVTRDILLAKIGKHEGKSVGKLIDGLGLMPEFKKAVTNIELRMGRRASKLGVWVLVFAAGTNGGYAVAKAYFDQGVDTVIYLHIDYDELVRLKKACEGNLVILGHMAGDSIGINAFLAALREKGLQVETLGVVN